MLLSKTVLTKWNSKTKKYYIDKGYEFTSMGDILEVDVVDLKDSSKEKVLIKCDVCGDKALRTYCDYLRRKIHDIDVCSKGKCRKVCCVITNNNKYGVDFPMQNTEIQNKAVMTIKEKYGVENLMELQEYRDKIKETFIEKYGVDNVFQLNEIKEKSKKTILKRYGVDHISKSKDFVSRVLKTKHERYGVGAESSIYEFMRKERHWNWKGGVSSEYHLDRTSVEYDEWRKSVFNRDNYTCMCCHNNKSGIFNAHHIVNFSENKQLRFDVDNGITLCVDCHSEFHKQHGYKNNNLKQLTEFINNYDEKIC